MGGLLARAADDQSAGNRHRAAHPQVGGDRGRRTHRVPAPMMDENDSPVPLPPFTFTASRRPSHTPLVPGVTQTVTGNGHAATDEACNGRWTYTVTENVETFPVL